MQTYYLKQSHGNEATHSRNEKKPNTVGNLMLMGEEKQMRMSDSTKSYLSLFHLPPLSAPNKAQRRTLWLLKF